MSDGGGECAPPGRPVEGHPGWYLGSNGYVFHVCNSRMNPGKLGYVVDGWPFCEHEMPKQLEMMHFLQKAGAKWGGASG